MYANLITLKVWINSLGLVLTLIGVVVSFKNSPLNEWKIDGGGPETDFNTERFETKRKNRIMKTGIYIVLLGTVIQLVSNFLS